jgi:hypothetical protein
LVFRGAQRRYAAAVRNLIAASLLASAIAGVGCGPTSSRDPGPVPIPTTEPTLVVEVGSEYDGFVALADGAAVAPSRGAQGGYHLSTAVRVHDPTVTDVRMNLSARFEDGSAAGTASSVALTLERDGDARTARAMRIFIDADAALGKRVILRAEVVAADERHGAGERTVIVSSN